MTSSDQPLDHVPPHAESETISGPSDLEKNVKSRSTWMRLVFMLISLALLAVSRVVTAAVVVIQFFTALITGKPNQKLKSWGHSLAIYSYEVVDYVTFNSDTRPFPFDADWPTELPRQELPEEVATN